MESAPDRLPPHSLEAEEHVIACCLLDEGNTIDRCVEAQVTPDSFYSPANRLLFEVILDIRKTPTLEVLAEELKTRRQLDAVGGFATLMQITGRIPTTAHAGYMIEKVREKQHLRNLIKLAVGAAEKSYSFTGGIDELIEGVRTSLDSIRDSQVGQIIARPLSSFTVPPDDDPSILLGNRYLNRGDGALLVSTSGMGKSSMTLQMAAHWAIGRPVFGIACNAKPGQGLKSVIIQAEDSDGDIGEVWAGIVHSMKLTPAEAALIDKNVLLIEDRVNRGQAFINRVRAIVRKFKPDLLWINPLLAFADGDTTKAEVMGKFLREGLNQINANKEFAYFIIHHTPKPPQVEKGKAPGRKWNEVMYDGAGSADLTNWARAIMVLKATEEQGQFDLILAKRGSRAGVVVEVEQGAGVRLEITNVIPLKHASGHIKIEGRKKDLSVIFWEPRETAPESKQEEPSESHGSNDDGECVEWLKHYPSAGDEPEPYACCYKSAKDSGYVTQKMFDAGRKDLMKRGLVMQCEDLRYQRTEAGDLVFENL